MTHDGEVILSHFVTSPDLQYAPLTNPDLIVLFDESNCKNRKGNFQAGCAITTQHEPLERGNLSSAKAVQQAELRALTRACQLFIPTDSLAKVVLDNRIALSYLFAEQRGLCAEVTTP